MTESIVQFALRQHTGPNGKGEGGVKEGRLWRPGAVHRTGSICLGWVVPSHARQMAYTRIDAELEVDGAEQGWALPRLRMA
ncbi:hypothetical protein KQ945_03220 [Bacillus subtilis subsp. subtilis]|nr:hypothetical protein [Bacillus subtilis subsp. subtilis]